MLPVVSRSSSDLDLSAQQSSEEKSLSFQEVQDKILIMHKSPKDSRQDSPIQTETDKTETSMEQPSSSDEQIKKNRSRLARIAESKNGFGKSSMI